MSVKKEITKWMLQTPYQERLGNVFNGSDENGTKNEKRKISRTGRHSHWIGKDGPTYLYEMLASLLPIYQSMRKVAAYFNISYVTASIRKEIDEIVKIMEIVIKYTGEFLWMNIHRIKHNIFITLNAW